MIKHVYVSGKGKTFSWPMLPIYTETHVHYPSGLVHIYHKINGTWEYVSFYMENTPENN